MKTRKEKIEEFLKGLNTEIDILNCIDIESVNSFTDISGQIEDNNGFDIEIIYYSRAMEYLMENDNSLQESMSIASDYGYKCKNINSELLASLLASQNAREEFNELENEINEFFDTLNEEEETEE
jgi:hypothetical protein